MIAFKEAETLDSQIGNVLKQADNVLANSGAAINDYVRECGKPRIGTIHKRAKERLEEMGISISRGLLLYCVIKYYRAMWGNYRVNRG